MWFQDEARIGQKNKITRRWAKRGTRPVALQDQRTASAYIFGAICPQEGKGAALVLPRCDISAMNLHLAEIAACVAPGAHAVLLLDQAAWHLSDRVAVPANITLLPLPPKCPGRVSDWRGGGEVRGVAVGRRLTPRAGASIRSVAPFPVAARQTGRAVFLHPAFT
ncbi:MAG: transposase [Acetobacteraceae bacterium]|nr:transposase [Acetobacteraceae bacterium]